MSNNVGTKIFDFDRWNRRLEQDKKEYQNKIPFPHVIFDDFLEKSAAVEAYKAFPPVKSEGWIHYIHVYERKHGLNKMDILPVFLQEVIKELNSDEFI